MTDFACFSVNNWEKRRARKQQFMLALSERSDVGKVLYIEPPLSLFRLMVMPFAELKDRENRRRWARALSGRPEPLSQKLFICTPLFVLPFSFRLERVYNVNLWISSLAVKRAIDRLGMSGYVLWFYHPFDLPLLKWLDRRALAVYDWAEEWAAYFKEYGAERRGRIRALEEEAVRRSDIVFVVSQNMLEQARGWNKNSHQLLDGTVPDVFRKTALPAPADAAAVKRPVLGYLGTVSQRVDLDLLRYISEALPGASLVIVGEIHRDSSDMSKLSGCGNIHFLGGKRFEELGGYTSIFDVCILPYHAGPSCRLEATFPTKLFDYLATGKPIVSTALEEVKRFSDHIYIAPSREEFVSCVNKALNENDDTLARRRIALAAENSWGRRAEEIMGFIGRALK